MFTYLSWDWAWALICFMLFWIGGTLTDIDWTLKRIERLMEEKQQ